MIVLGGGGGTPPRGQYVPELLHRLMKEVRNYGNNLYLYKILGKTRKHIEKEVQFNPSQSEIEFEPNNKCVRCRRSTAPLQQQLHRNWDCATATTL